MVIAACLRFTPAAAAGAHPVSPILNQRRGCLLLCFSVQLRRHVFVLNAVRANVVECGNESALAEGCDVCQTKAYCVCVSQMMDSKDNAGTLRCLAASSLPSLLKLSNTKDLACRSSSIQKFDSHRRSLFFSSQIERLWLPLPDAPNGSPS